MVLESDHTGATPHGEALTRMLEWHRDFILRGYSLLRHIRGELERTLSLRVLTYNGYVSRDGTGSGSNLRAEGALQTYLGIALVPAESHPADNDFAVLCVQIRWLDRSPTAPILWAAVVRGHFDPAGPTSLDAYYTGVFPKLERARDPDAVPGSIEICSVPRANQPTLHVTGRYHEVPLVALHDEASVRDLFVEPAVALWRSHLHGAA